MAPLGLVKRAADFSEPPVSVVPEIQLRVEDALASAGRLWVRGQLLGGPLPLVRTGKNQHWWRRWWRRQAASSPLSRIRLETRISGHLFDAEVPLEPEGHFEATFSAELPVARRGWRIARNRVTWGSKTVEQCGVVVSPADDARGVVVVILPLDYTSGAHGAQRLARSEEAARWTPVLRRLHQDPCGGHAIFYVAGVPPHGACELAELALATTTLGWPAGSLLLLPLGQDAPERMVIGLDRLRWLFAGTLDLCVLNLEPRFTAAFTVLLQPRDERAVVHRILGPHEDPATLFADALPGLVRERNVALRPARSGLVPRYPVVFCHGMLAMTTLQMKLPKDLNCFSPLREFLRERGIRALFPQVSPTSGIKARARQLREQIQHWTDEPVNIIAHSMGGLDARYLITHLGMADHVRSLLTIATPHRGTYLADWFLSNFRNRFPLLLALEALGMNIDGFHDCRPAACQDFNAHTPDIPGVRYFSFGGAVSPAQVIPPLRRGCNLLTPIEGPNDGLVSVASARWGEYLGTIPVDHFVQTPDHLLPVPTQPFDALGFYFRLLEDLARRGL
jgi:triacylglycerol lipase